MTLLEALEDIGKGRIIDNGCDYELIALAKGRYTFTFWRTGGKFEIILTGKQGDNARQIQREFFNYCEKNHLLYNEITSADYTK